MHEVEKFPEVKKPEINGTYLIRHRLGAGEAYDVAVYMQAADGSKVFKGTGWETVKDHIEAVYELYYPEDEKQEQGK